LYWLAVISDVLEINQQKQLITTKEDKISSSFVTGTQISILSKFRGQALYIIIANRPAPTIAKLLPIIMFASIADAAPVCWAAVTEADGLPVVVLGAVLAAVLALVGMPEGALTVTPIAAQIWMEIDPNAIRVLALNKHVETQGQGRYTYSGYR
jgi:hypothetical protein